MAKTYRIVRFFRDGDPPSRKLKNKRGLTLEQAQEHCRDPQTSSRTATNRAGIERTRINGPWFDGYEEEK